MYAKMQNVAISEQFLFVYIVKVEHPVIHATKSDKFVTC